MSPGCWTLNAAAATPTPTGRRHCRGEVDPLQSAKQWSRPAANNIVQQVKAVRAKSRGPASDLLQADAGLQAGGDRRVDNDGEPPAGGVPEARHAHRAADEDDLAAGGDR